MKDLKNLDFTEKRRKKYKDKRVKREDHMFLLILLHLFKGRLDELIELLKRIISNVFVIDEKEIMEN